MKTEIFGENKNNVRKIEKINKKANSIQSKSLHSNSFKQKGYLSSSINKINSNLPNLKKDENNNSSLINSQKKNSIPNNKFSKLNKFPINKKLNIIKETSENQTKMTKNKNNFNKKFIQRNNDQILTDKNKSYIGEEKKKGNIGQIKKKDGDSILVNKLTLQDDTKYSFNMKFKQSKSSNIDSLTKIKNRKERENNKNNQVINTHKNTNSNTNNNFIDINNKKSKLKKILNLKKNNEANQDDIFIYDESKPITLTPEEIAIYGDRSMKGYNKMKILGKGGYGVVWLCRKMQQCDDNNDMDYAVKQTSKKNAPAHNKEDVLQIANNEINILMKLNENNVEEEEEKKCDLIPEIYETYEDNNDIWFSFEKGGLSLSTLTFNIKGIFEKGERLYHIQKGEFLVLLFKNIKQFKLLIRKILEGIDYINKKGIIHSDIKPENILVQYIKNKDNLEITSIKIIDYGSAFYSSNQSPLISNTPEYLCPEIMTNKKEFIKELNYGNYLNAIDIWSTGISILELCLCCPIWMSYKTKIYINGKINNNMGYFGCKGRDGNKIYQKQIELSQNLNKILKNSMIYMFDNKSKAEFIDLLSKMLTFDYTKRITTKEALKHPFLNEYNNEEIIEENKENNIY